MAEIHLPNSPRRFWRTTPLGPTAGRLLALTVLIGLLASIVAYIWVGNPPAATPPDEPVLEGEVTAILRNFSHVETVGGRNRFLLTAEVDKAYANGSHELTNVELISFGETGERRDKIAAGACLYNQRNALVVFRNDVRIETSDGMRVEGAEFRYDQERQSVESEAPLRFWRTNVEGTCRGALVEPELQRLVMRHDVDMTFRSVDEAASSPALAPEQAEKRKKGGGQGKGKKGTKKDGQASAATPPVDFGKGPRIPVRVRSASAMFDQRTGVARYDGGVQVVREGDQMRASVIEAALTPENRLKSIEARGQAMFEASGRARATSADMAFEFGEGNQLVRAVATGAARVVWLGEPPDRSVTADRLDIELAPAGQGSVLHKVTGSGSTVVIMAAPPASAAVPNPCARELRAAQVHLEMHPGGEFARSAEASGGVVLTVTPIRDAPRLDRKRVAAEQMRVDFFETGNLGREFSAEGNVVFRLEPTAEDGRAVRETSSATAHALFDRASQDVEEVEQRGDFKYVEDDRHAVADVGRYLRATGMVTLRRAGGPERSTVWDSRCRTVADEIDLRAEARSGQARGDVRTTYYSSETAGRGAPFRRTKTPVFLTARVAEFTRERGGVAIFTGAARAWQEDNYVKADVIRLYDQDCKMEAEGAVETGLYRLVRKNEKGEASVVPVFTTAGSLRYLDGERHLHYEKGVVTRQAPDEIRSDVQDVWLGKGEQADVERAIATGAVSLTSPGRTGRGDRLVYTAADQKAVLTGTNARVEDVERGVTTGPELVVVMGGDRIDAVGQPGAGRVKTTHKIRNKEQRKP
jgi:lipopolysaccharide export system protein LptA